MTANEIAVRNAYRVAENKDVQGWVNCLPNLEAALTH